MDDCVKHAYLHVSEGAIVELIPSDNFLYFPGMDMSHVHQGVHVKPAPQQLYS